MYIVEVDISYTNFEWHTDYAKAGLRIATDYFSISRTKFKFWIDINKNEGDNIGYAY